MKENIKLTNFSYLKNFFKREYHVKCEKGGLIKIKKKKKKKIFFFF